MARGKKKSNAGRPAKITKDVLAKLRDGFAFTYTDEEACLYAGIDPATLYRYQKKHPEFCKEKEQLRLTPNLMAKKVLVENLPKNVEQARWWADRKIKDFKPKQEVEHSGTIVTTPMQEAQMTPKMQEAVQQFKQAYEEQLHSEIDAMPDELPN